MDADLQARVAFYLTGREAGTQVQGIDGLGLIPALLSGYRDLTRLRYDFPLVLIDSDTDENFAEPLSGVLDAVLEKIAVGKDADRLRKHVLRLEAEIRTLTAGGATARLSELWDRTAEPLAAGDTLLADSLARARANLKVDGEVADCDRALPHRLLKHAWALIQRQRAGKFAADLNRLVLRISDILKTDFINSDEGKNPDNLKSAFGSGPLDHFDFEAMSRLLTKASPKARLPESRRLRLTKLLSVLESQQFFPTGTSAAPEAYSFIFNSCAEALDAYRERLPKVISLARAIAIAELEIKGEYNEVRHDLLFESFGENGLDTRDLAIFPDYLVFLDAARMTSAEQEQLTEIMSADLPMKILLQTDDIIEKSPVGSGHLTYARRSRRITSIALGMNDVFVMQAPSSSLYRLRSQLWRGLECSGPALYSVFSGATGASADFPAYLVAAAALESRVFPAFAYDPAAGRDWASRFSLDGNPQSDQDWPLHEFRYEDAHCQAISEQLPFTLVDFVACDPRYSRHFAKVPPEKWDATLVSVVQPAAQENRWHIDQVPSLLMVDRGNGLQKVIVNEKLIRAAHRCRERWLGLQEFGGIHNSYVEKLLAREKQAWEAHMKQAAQEVAGDPPASPQAPATTPLALVALAQEPERSPDEAYIETPRCSTCNECTQLNNKMFAYDANQQAYIADITAGTYAQLVEAAESCQVSVIHPGKPRNPNEPGLEELLKRAEAFL